MKVLYASWELDPYIKLGGLGDVARSLPAALGKNGVDIKNVMPFYKAVKIDKKNLVKTGELEVEYDGRSERVIIYETINPTNRIPLFLLQNRKYLSFADSQNNFAFFAKAIVEIIRQKTIAWIPDIIHCNDHHLGLLPLLVRHNKLKVKTILTIHNLSYQGHAPIAVIEKLGLKTSHCRPHAWEIKSRQLNFLLEGIIHADVINTVSPTYAREIMREEFGMGLEDILRGKEGRVFGILNGIDKEYNNLLHYQALDYPFLSGIAGGSKKLYSWQEGKKHNKAHLQEKMKLKIDSDIPIFAFIGRFDAQQKGIDILHKLIRRGAYEKYQFVILGNGNSDWEERYAWLSKFYPESVSCNFLFDPHLAHLIYAGADFILIPSRFEPCGLIQMIAMTSGTLPIAHKTGGLADSIKNGRNGFLFENYTSESLGMMIDKAVDIQKNDRAKYEEMVSTAMRTDFSWDKSAREYIGLYDKLYLGEY
ncbi:MAG: glycogen/starch synthase, starch synthase [Candidatus Gottesmanbacteria bacterium GW2011_GWA2_43_14]|uniref:Glycogen synthase n=1 Tax=Candidatus Gottesmanbacteria bacterium GW2011_GWA2_43_14 TaxID=1618443 RepID=A0A0G1DJC9_9BACT|nr:MAG: glycogen/starch synthase, starch synthase [Candidatus Gottesmanbacteria bacterium GW2011_GWA2_43_14]